MVDKASKNAVFFTKSLVLSKKKTRKKACNWPGLIGIAPAKEAVPSRGGSLGASDGQRDSNRFQPSNS